MRPHHRRRQSDADTPLPRVWPRRTALRVLVSATVGLAVARLTAARLDGATVRGRVLRTVGRRTYPAPDVRVTIAPVSRRARGLLTYTDTDGMFVFRQVGTGTWRLAVWSSRSQASQTREVTVQEGQSYVDVPPITI